ncbi:MAG: 3-deoxy-D-manno-octulosonic acid transferase [Planctomycetota bacterium]|nr:3-deoxy-D-manno-octulosonic acid transferase [Planctomycetota bacterium]
MLHWGMDAIYGGIVAALPLYGLWRLVSDRKARSRWRAYVRDIPLRFGRREARRADRPCVWVHGVSVGEVKAAARLVEVIEERIPDVEVIITVTTDTGNRVARKRYPDHRVEFYPPDLSWIVEHTLDALRPDLMVLVESEFWPNFLFSARARRLPVALVNGRMSPRSARRFKKLESLSRPLLETLSSVCVQVDSYAERFTALGLDPDRVHVTGNMKLDNIPLKTDPDRRARYAQLLGSDQDDLATVVAGSTHPGEERAIARMRRRLAAEGKRFRLIVVPRHPARAEGVAAEMRKEGQTVVFRSQLEGAAAPGPDDVVLLDTVGELEVVFALADIVFIGGSLVPHGGQNVMEPASLGKPVVVGPHIHNFRGEVDMLLQAGGIELAADASGVEAAIRRWLDDPTAAAECGSRARDVINASKGATTRTIEILSPLLDDVVAKYAR